MVGPHAASVAAADRSQRPIFCLFDNAKVNASRSSRQPFYYMFETLPFALCPNVVYSSVGIADGQLVSRLPLFEQKHGLPLLRQIVNKQGFQDTRILLVLGGRKEDAPHFWRLGRDPNTFDLLMKNVVDGMIKFQLDGVTVHWMEPTSNCSGTDHDLVLSILLHRLKETFAKRGLTRHVVSVMLDMRADNRYLLNSVANVVNYFFIGTNVLRYTGRGPFQDICANLSHAPRVVISSYASFSKNVGADQLCIMVELAPWGAAGFELPTGAWIANGRKDLVVLVDTSPLRVPIAAPPPSPTYTVTSPERRFLDRDEATPPRRAYVRPAVGIVGRFDISSPPVIVAASHTLPYLKQEHRNDRSYYVSPV
nr:uncharacterized protein LOC119165246 [Rhipicephalus microplus]